MPNEKWKHIQWKRDGSDNALIREFLADPDSGAIMRAVLYCNTMKQR